MYAMLMTCNVDDVLQYTHMHTIDFQFHPRSVASSTTSLGTWEQVPGAPGTETKMLIDAPNIECSLVARARAKAIPSSLKPWQSTFLHCYAHAQIL